MRAHVTWYAVVAGLAAVLAVDVPASAQQLVSSGSSWRYNDTGANLGTAWQTAGYNDGAWPWGNAQLGYGDGDEATVISFGGNTSNRYITYYFRREFTVATPSAVAALTLRVRRDDGCVVYVNGVEVMRSNMPTGAVTSTTRATTAIGGADESAWIETPVDPARLVAGSNLIAVEVHQQSPTSSDVTFDLELVATPAATPSVTVALTSPAHGAVLNGTTVTFSATATATAGLANARLLVGGAPQTVTLSGPSAVQDTQITADSPTTPGGAALEINVDGATPHAHGLIRFPSLVGGASGQVTAGSTIVSATLTLNCTNAGQAMAIYRVTEDWSADQATWNERTSGVPWGAVGADGPASNAGVSVTGNCTAVGLRAIDLTRFVQEWASGAPNYGVVLTDTGTDGIDFSSSESGSSPVLAVTFKAPLAPLGTQAVSGSSAVIQFPVTMPALAAITWNIEVTDVNGVAARAPADFSATVDVASPDEPVLVSPADGATAVDSSGPLVARVSSPGGGSISATAAIRAASGEEFTIVVLPDTQHYSESFPAIFTAQTQWIVANRAARNIVFVTHEGDIVQNYNVTSEWQAANASMSLLDGVVPYGLAPGNHDQPSTLYNQYFPYTRYLGLPWYGGHYQSLNDNNYQLFSGGGMDFVAVHLEFCPSSAVVAWAKSVFDSYPNRIGMMTTHGYLNESAARSVHGCTNTQYLWDNLGAVTPNLHFMLSGHVHDESRRQDMANGHPVFQMLADYQGRASGGEGWLRILRFVPADNRVYVQTYSPWLDRYETDANSEFALDFQMTPSFMSSAPVVVPSGSDASFIPAGLNGGSTYEWRVTATNEAGRSRTSPTWRFTTAPGSPTNRAPTASGESYSVAAGSTLAVPAPGVLGNDSDADGDALTASVVTGPAHGVLALALDGSLTYTPVSGYVGPDSFTYAASDAALTSPSATVTLTVTGISPGPVFTSTFASGADGFSYVDNTFRGATQGSYASGSYVATAGYSGGGLRIYLGGINNTLITDMSGGWRRSFALSAAAPISLTFRYRLNQGPDYESDELSQVLASLDGVLVGGATSDYVIQVAGDGNGGAAVDTGWRQVTIDLGTLASGTHTLTLGGYNSKKTSTSERTTIWIDDVSVIVP